MGKRAPTPPPPVDPSTTIAAQQNANSQAAQEQQRLGMIGTTGPGGSVRYVADPSSPGGYRQVTELDPGQQRIYDLGIQGQIGALDLANTQLGRLGTALGQNVLPPELMGSFDQGNPIQTSYNAGNLNTSYAAGSPLNTNYSPTMVNADYSTGKTLRDTFDFGGDVTGTFDPGQAVQGSVGPTDFSADREAVTNSVLDQARSRLDPSWSRDQNRLETRLANQGLSQNSTAYQSEMDRFGRAKNDAYDQALWSGIRAGSDQQQRLFDQSVTQGNFANAAAGQQFGQNLGTAQFGNQAQQQRYDQNLGAGQFFNAAQGQTANQNRDRATLSLQAQTTNAANAMEAQRMNNAARMAQDEMNRNRAMFGNDAMLQQAGLNRDQAVFGNQAGAQQFGQNQSAADFANNAAQQNYQNQNFARTSPLQDFSALMGYSGVQMPGAYTGSTPGVAPADALGAYSLYQQGQNNNYNAQVANRSANNQALGGLAGAAFLGPLRNIFG